MIDYTIENQDFVDYHNLTYKIYYAEEKLKEIKTRIEQYDKFIQRESWYIGVIRDGKINNNNAFISRMGEITDYIREEQKVNVLIENAEVLFNKLKNRKFMV